MNSKALKSAIEADIKAGFKPDEVKERAKARVSGKNPPDKKKGEGSIGFPATVLLVIAVLLIVAFSIYFAGAL